LIQAVLLAAVNSGNRKTWHILLPAFQFGSNNYIMTEGVGGSSITPLLDRNGNAVIDK
jgi:hypothetical protein